MNLVQEFNMIKTAIIIGGSALTLAEIYSYYLKNKVFKNDCALANGKLADIKDISDLTSGDGLILSKEVQLREKFGFEGVAVFGPTGCGKTSSFFYPNLLSNNITGSIIVTDPKGELFRDTSVYQKNVCGRRIFKFSPLEPQTSEHYNLLENCKDNSEVIELSSTLLFNGALSIELATGKKSGGVEWIQMAEPLLASALLYAKDQGKPYNTIEFAFQLLITLKTDELDTIFSSCGNLDVQTQWNIFKVIGGADRTEGSIKITLASNMKLFTDTRINMIGENTTFDIKTFREVPSILYITYPENKSTYIAPFIAPFFSQILDNFINRFTKKDLPIYFLFDEFANIGYISNMSINVATIRSRKISMNICLQSLAQLYQTYGRENGKAIMNNLKTKMVYPSISDEDTLNFISNLCGEKEIEISSRSENKSGMSKSYNKTKIRMFSTADLRCMNDNQILILISNRQPFLAIQNSYYKNTDYIQNISEPIKIAKQINKNTVRTIKDKILKLQVNAEVNNDIGDVKDSLFR